MLKLNKSLLAGIVLMLLFMVGCEKTQKNYILKVDKHTVLSETFVKRFQTSNEYRKGSEISPEIIKTYLDKTFLDNLLLQAEGYRINLDKDEKLVELIEQRKVSMLTDGRSKMLKKVQDVDVIITDKDIEDFYNSMNQEIKVAHIMIRSKTLADSLYGELQKDKTKYHDFAEKYSLDVRSGQGGGVLGKFFTKGTFPSAFEEGAFVLEKLEISQPIKTRFGYHIIKLMDKKPFENQPLDKVKDGLKKKLESIEKNKSFGKFFDDLYEETNLTINEKLLPYISKNMDTKNRMLKVNKSNIPVDELNKIIMEHKNDKWTLGVLIDNYNSSQPRGKMPLKSSDMALDYIYKTVTPDLIYNKAISEGYDKDEDYLQQIKKLEEQQVLRTCKQKLINDKVNVSDKEIEAYFTENKEKYKDKTLDKVKPRIKNEIAANKRKNVTKELIAKIKEQFLISYNDKEIDRLVIELNEKKKKEAEVKAARAKQKKEQKQSKKPVNAKKKNDIKKK